MLAIPIPSCHRRHRLRRRPARSTSCSAAAARSAPWRAPRRRLPAGVDARRGDVAVRRRPPRGARRRAAPPTTSSTRWAQLGRPRLRRARTARRRSTSARRRATRASSASIYLGGLGGVRPALRAPALAPRGRRAAAPARAGARLRARGDDHRPGQRVLRHPRAPHQAPAGDDRPALAGHAHAADRAQRRGRAPSPTWPSATTSPAEVQLGGADVLTYREMMRRAAPLMGRRRPLVVRVPVPHAAPVVLLGRPGDARSTYGARQAARRRARAEMVVDARRRRRASTTSRWASTTPSAPRCREAPQPPARAPDRQRGDRRPRGAHRDGRARRGALDPGRRTSTCPTHELDAIWYADEPRAARPDLLEVPLARHARDHPRRPTPDRARSSC